MTLKKNNCIETKIILWVTKELTQCASLISKQKIVEKVLQHEVMMATLLPKYYPRPHEAKAQLAFIKSFQSQLGSMKSSHSNNVLTRKGVLLESTINQDAFYDRLVSVKTFSRLLGTKRRNIHHALMR
jgi:hypothetical protein